MALKAEVDSPRGNGVKESMSRGAGNVAQHEMGSNISTVVEDD